MAKSKIKKANNPWTTIWTNPNPNQNFANNQTIAIDLSLYTELCFELQAIVNGGVNYYFVVPAVNTVTVLSCVGSMINRRYNVAISSEYINFGQGARVDSYANSIDDTSRAIPLRVLAR